MAVSLVARLDERSAAGGELQSLRSLHLTSNMSEAGPPKAELSASYYNKQTLHSIASDLLKFLKIAEPCISPYWESYSVSELSTADSTFSGTLLQLRAVQIPCLGQMSPPMAQKNILDDTILRVLIPPTSGNDSHVTRKFDDYKANVLLALTTASHLFSLTEIKLIPPRPHHHYHTEVRLASSCSGPPRHLPAHCHV